MKSPATSRNSMGRSGASFPPSSRPPGSSGSRLLRQPSYSRPTCSIASSVSSRLLPGTASMPGDWLISFTKFSRSSGKSAQALKTGYAGLRPGGSSLPWSPTTRAHVSTNKLASPGPYLGVTETVPSVQTSPAASSSSRGRLNRGRNLTTFAGRSSPSRTTKEQLNTAGPHRRTVPGSGRWRSAVLAAAGTTPLRGSRRVVRRVIKARPPHLRTGRDLRAHRRRPTCASSRIAAAETLWKICVPLVSFRRRQTFLDAGFPTASRSRALSIRPFVFSFA